MAKEKAAMPLHKQMAESPKEPTGTARLMSKAAVNWVDKVGQNIDAEAHLARLFQEVRKNPSLAKCDPASLIGCGMEAATLGLSFGGAMGQAYAVPYYDNKSRGWKAQFQVGYRGYVSKMVDNVTTYGISANWICENDAYDYDVGEGWIKHKPVLRDRGEVIGAWAKAVHNNGVNTLVVLDIDQIEDARNASSSYKNALKGGYADNTPWGQYFGAMTMKTAIHRLAKLVPMSSNLADMMNSDGAVFTGLNDGVAVSYNPELLGPPQLEAQPEEV